MKVYVLKEIRCDKRELEAHFENVKATIDEAEAKSWIDNDGHYERSYDTFELPIGVYYLNPSMKN